MTSEVKNFQGVFEESQIYIKEIFGLDLTLIEKVRLRRHTLDSIVQFAKGCENIEHNSFYVAHEAASRFMSDCYGMPPVDRKFVYWTEEFGDSFLEYMRRLQQRSHIP